MNELLITSVEQGLVFAILAMGVFLTYKVLDISDLTVEGSFPLGAFVFARFASAELGPIVSTAWAFAAGALAGLLTAILFTKMKITPLLSGILTMTILYSVNLRINGRSNIPLYSYGSIFDYGSALIVLGVIVLVLKLLIDWFLTTEKGYLLIATGDNETLVRSLGQNSDTYKIIGTMLSNGLAALSGALMAQLQGFVDITMGNSIIVVALASIIIGDAIWKSFDKLRLTSRSIIGAIIYRVIHGLAIDWGMEPGDLKMVSAVIVIIFLSYNNVAAGLFKKKGRRDRSNDVKNSQPIEKLQ